MYLGSSLYIWPCTVAGNVLFVSHLRDTIVYFMWRLQCLRKHCSAQALHKRAVAFNARTAHVQPHRYTHTRTHVYTHARAHFHLMYHWAQANAPLKISAHIQHTHTHTYIRIAMMSFNRKEKRKQHIHPVGSTIGCGLEAHFMKLISWNINRRMLAPIDLSLELHVHDWNKCPHSYARQNCFSYITVFDSQRRNVYLVQYLCLLCCWVHWKTYSYKPTKKTVIYI